VSVHSVAPVNAPFIVNAPTKKLYSAKVGATCAQHSEYLALPAVPAVAVLSANASYGAPDVVTGFVSPDKDANALVPHVAVERITRTAFVDASPFVVHVNCRSQLAVSVQSVAWLSGPCNMNIPTAKLNFVTSAPGEWDQHSV
jgi:hypothetical protein